MNGRLLRRAASSLLALVSLAGCGSDATSPPPEHELRLVVVAGDEQEAPAGTTLPEPLVAQLTNAAGEPYRFAPGVVLNWMVTTGGGATFVVATQTDWRGEARNWWTLGQPGAQTLEVRAVHPTTGERLVYGTFSARATSTEARRYHFEQSYDGTHATAGQPWSFKDHVKVFLVDQDGNFLKYADFSVTANNGGCSWTTTTITCPTSSAGVVIDFQQEGFDGVENPAFRPVITLPVD